jgi:hypothetical protein
MGGGYLGPLRSRREGQWTAACRRSRNHPWPDNPAKGADLAEVQIAKQRHGRQVSRVSASTGSRPGPATFRTKLRGGRRDPSTSAITDDGSNEPP